ncbi:DESI1 [Symbiodinium natans]|uniref:DESI1 protein n=1 Tax=Symbiodinium natans TaxID=878477 RepID=A0A812RW86_9DINO|nr:DESI1 [Symbiodinium natans]
MIVRDLASQVQSLEDFLSAEVPPWKQDPSDLCAYLDAYMMAERPVQPLEDFLSNNEGHFPVYLWIYDLSRGFASHWAETLVGIKLEGIWHTSVVVEWPQRSSEFSFGGQICECKPGTTPYGQPLEKRFLGYTAKTRLQVRKFFIRLCLATDDYDGRHYDLLCNNCNHFTHKLLQHLFHENLPGKMPDVLDQPSVVRDTAWWVKAFEAKRSFGCWPGSTRRALQSGTRMAWPRVRLLVTARGMQRLGDTWPEAATGSQTMPGGAGTAIGGRALDAGREGGEGPVQGRRGLAALPLAAFAACSGADTCDLVALVHEEAGARNMSEASLGCWVVELALQPPAEDREDASALAWSISEHPSPLTSSTDRESLWRAKSFHHLSGCPTCAKWSRARRGLARATAWRRRRVLRQNPGREESGEEDVLVNLGPRLCIPLPNGGGQAGEARQLVVSTAKARTISGWSNTVRPFFGWIQHRVHLHVCYVCVCVCVRSYSTTCST